MKTFARKGAVLVVIFCFVINAFASENCHFELTNGKSLQVQSFFNPLAKEDIERFRPAIEGHVKHIVSAKGNDIDGMDSSFNIDISGSLIMRLIFSEKIKSAGFWTVPCILMSHSGNEYGRYAVKISSSAEVEFIDYATSEEKNSYGKASDFEKMLERKKSDANGKFALFKKRLNDRVDDIVRNYSLVVLAPHNTEIMTIDADSLVFAAVVYHKLEKEAKKVDREVKLINYPYQADNDKRFLYVCVMPISDMVDGYTKEDKKHLAIPSVDGPRALIAGDVFSPGILSLTRNNIFGFDSIVVGDHHKWAGRSMETDDNFERGKVLLMNTYMFIDDENADIYPAGAFYADLLEDGDPWYKQARAISIFGDVYNGHYNSYLTSSPDQAEYIAKMINIEGTYLFGWRKPAVQDKDMDPFRKEAINDLVAGLSSGKTLHQLKGSLAEHLYISFGDEFFRWYDGVNNEVLLAVDKFLRSKNKVYFYEVSPLIHRLVCLKLNKEGLFGRRVIVQYKVKKNGQMNTLIARGANFEDIDVKKACMEGPDGKKWGGGHADRGGFRAELGENWNENDVRRIKAYVRDAIESQYKDADEGDVSISSKRVRGIVPTYPVKGVGYSAMMGITKEKQEAGAELIAAERTNKALARAKSGNRLTHFLDIPAAARGKIKTTPELMALLHKENVLIVMPPMEIRMNSPPFLWKSSKDDFLISCTKEGNTYIPMGLLAMNRPTLTAKILKDQIGIENEADETNEDMAIAKLVFSLWSVRKGIELPGRAKPYAETCESMIESAPSVDYRNSVDDVIDPVVRGAWAKTKVVLGLEEKGWKQISANNRVPGHEEWIDAVMHDTAGKKTLVHTHQAYFHPGHPVSETLESLWRLGAGSIEIAAEYLENVQRSLESKGIEYSGLSKAIKEAIYQINDGNKGIKERRQEATKILDSMDMGTRADDELIIRDIDAARKMLKRGWVDNVLTNFVSEDVKNVTGNHEKTMIFIDTRFDEITAAIKKDKLLEKELRKSKDPVARRLIRAYDTGEDLIWKMIEERMQWDKNISSSSGARIMNFSDSVKIPDKHMIFVEIADLLNRKENTDTIEGILYSRYCGLLLELVGLEHFLNNGYEIVDSGIEIFDEKGNYVTELDIVVRKKGTKELFIVEAKSVRSRFSKSKVLKSKVENKLKTYRERIRTIEHALGEKVSGVVFVMDVGWQEDLKIYLEGKRTDLIERYGFPLEFAFLSMGDKVEKHTGYVQSLSKKPAKGKAKAKVPAQQKAAKVVVGSVQREIIHSHKTSRQEVKRVLRGISSSARVVGERDTRWDEFVRDRMVLSSIDGVLADFDGVTKSHNKGMVTEEMVLLARNIAEAGIRFCTVTSRSLDGLLKGYGGPRNFRLMEGVPYTVVTHAGAMAYEMKGHGNFSLLEGYDPVMNDDGERIFGEFTAILERILRGNGLDAKEIFEEKMTNDAPYGMTLKVDVPELTGIKEEIFKTLDARIAEMKGSGEVSQNTNVVKTADSIDIAVASKGYAASQLIKEYGLRNIVIMGDSIGTEECPGNDRSMLTMTKEDLRDMGIPWWNEVTLYRIYVGSEKNADIPDDVIVAPISWAETEAPRVLYREILKANGKRIEKKEEIGPQKDPPTAGARPLIKDWGIEVKGDTPNYFIKSADANEAIVKGRDLASIDGLASTLVETLVSSLINKKIVLIFEQGLGGYSSGEIAEFVEIIEEIKKGDQGFLGKYLSNLDVIISPAENIAENIEKCCGDNTRIFVFTRDKNAVLVDKQKRAVFSVIEDGAFPKDAYYPLPEIVTMTLLVDKDRYSLGLANMAAKAVNIERIDMKNGYLVFFLLPDAVPMVPAEKRQRYEAMKRIMVSP